MRLSISILFFILLLFGSSSVAYGQKSYDESHLEVSLRMVGHRILLDAGDSTSQVLPIKKEDERYRIEFASEFAVNQDNLVNIINEVMKDAKIKNGYIVELEDCNEEDIIYSYEVGQEGRSDITPCGGRDIPSSCYSILFTLKENEDQSAALTSIGPQSSQFNKLMIPLAVILFSGVFFFIWNKRKKDSIDPNIIALGEYQFDKRNTELINDNQRIELTHKEAELLLLLHDSANMPVEREVILNMVWGDQGDYVGRTLDVFISKLRKKLEADPGVKIVNIRGIGYKLVVNG